MKKEVDNMEHRRKVQVNQVNQCNSSKTQSTKLTANGYRTSNLIEYAQETMD